MQSENTENRLLSIVRDGVEIPCGEVWEQMPADRVYTERLDIRHSCELAADKKTDYRTALYVTKNGIEQSGSVTAAVRGGRFDDSAADGVCVEAGSPGFSGLIVNGGSYRMENAKIRLHTDADGKDTCDFVGLGSAVNAFSGARIELKNCDIETAGVAKCAVFADEGSDVVILDSRLSAMGGKLYEGYVNSADFNYMVAPPWVLGITGSARATNLMGRKSSTVLVGCDVKAANWGVLSTDNGEDNELTVIDTDLTLVGSETDKKNPWHKAWGSGYGTYILGANEDFRGVRMRAGTYIGIAREGNAVYRSSGGHIRVLSPSTGDVIYEGDGSGRVSELNSDLFGIMAHDRAELVLTDGTVMNTGDAAFLMKAGGVSIRVEDGARINTENGVLLQVMDDDDQLVGVDWNAPKEIQFHTEFREKAGWPSENGQITSHMPPPDPSDMPPPPPDGEEMPEPRFDVRFRASDTVLNGDIFNGSGYYGLQAKQLYITLGAGASLTGSVSATETIHVDENGKQNTYFTINEYYYLGHVANRPFFNGDNAVEVELEAGSAWVVTGHGVISALTVHEGASFRGVVRIGGEVVVPEPGRTYAGVIEIDKET